MRSIVKLVIIAALFAPLMLAQKKAAAAQSPTGLNQTSTAPTATSDTAQDPNQGQASETPNQRRRRLAAQKPGPPSPGEYPFKEAIETLQAPTPPPRSVAKRPIDSTPAVKAVKKAEPTKGDQPKTAVPSSATAEDVIQMSNHWKDIRDTPAEGKDGRVVFADGAGLPTVVCAPLRLCTIELQAGEKLTGEPQIGDSSRWRVEPGSYGSAETITPLIVLKPMAVGLDTTLVIMTDRRAYYLRLISSPENYVARISFDHPDEDRAKWVKTVNNPPGPPTGLPLVGNLEDLNHDYQIKGDATIRPEMVLDDGVHTYIRMNASVLRRELPVLAVIGPDGKAEMVNYRVQGSVYIVDRLFDRGRLILGSGRKALKADMIRGATKDRSLFARDPFRGVAKTGQPGDKTP